MPVILALGGGDRWITGACWPVNPPEFVNSRFNGVLLRKKHPPLTSGSHVHTFMWITQKHNTHVQKHTKKCLCALDFMCVCYICISLYILYIVYLCTLDFLEEGSACSVIALGLIVLAWLPPLPTSFFPMFTKSVFLSSPVSPLQLLVNTQWVLA